MIVIAIIAIIAAIAIPNLLEARKGTNEAAAIGALRTIGTAQHLFQQSDRDLDDRYDYANNLNELLVTGRLVDSQLGAGTKLGYSFAVVTADSFYWAATASPITPGRSGDRYFFVDQSGVIRFSTNAAADLSSTPVGG